TSPISGNPSKKNSATDKNLALWEPDDVRYTKDQRDTLKEYEKKYSGKVYKDNFWGQSQANYAAGSFMQEIYAAYNDYWNDPSDENWMYAQALEILQEDFVKRNAAALDNEGVVLPWLSQSAAGYLPQLQDQTMVSLNSAALGAGVGAGVGSVIPGLGTATGAIWGGRTGYVTGRTLHSREQMRGAAFRQLLANGVDYETAKKAANDESIVSAIIESGDAILDVATLGGAKALPLLAKYGFNIFGEGVEESLQEGVSIANENRTSTGVLDLIGETTSTLWDAATGQNDDARNRIVDAGNDGAKIAVMLGGAATAANSAVQSDGNYVGSTLNTISPQTSYSNGTPLTQKSSTYDLEATFQQFLASKGIFNWTSPEKTSNNYDFNTTPQEYFDFRSDSDNMPQESEFANYDSFTNSQDGATIKEITGARITDQYSPAAEVHAKNYYGLVRSMKTDASRIAKNIGVSRKDMEEIKRYLFIDEHDLGDGRYSRFDEDFAIAQSWQRLLAGTPESHDMTLINHEMMERALVESGLTQDEAHQMASKKYNYSKEAADYYASLEKH
ncbi:MAG: hypothetical protein IKC03_09110, partial [Oscillospiraceae bacterium]|nr:hypothetical protein [Oscillospiraceae bacterium]